MLTVTTLSGQCEPLVDVQGTAIKQRVNENYELSFTAVKTPNNTYAYDLLQDEAMITCEGENFIVKSLQELPYSKSIVSVHEFFEIIDDYVESKLSDNNYSIQSALSHAFSTTMDWDFIVEGNFSNAFLKDFGEDNPISLLNTILETYGAEYTVSSTDKIVRIKNKVGIETDYQVRFKHNLSSINRDVDASNVKTAVKVYYNADDYGGYSSSVIYYSAYRNNYRRTKWAEPIYLDDVTSQQDALNYAKNYLQDTPIVSIATEFVHLQESGYNSNDIALGNSFYLIDERLNLSESVRIVEVEHYPFDEGKSPTIVCSNARKSIEGVSVNQQIQQNMLDNEAVKQKEIYNGASMGYDDGIKINGRNGVVIWLNADHGIMITNGSKQEFYVDTNGNVTFDGRLNITENGQTLLEAYMDNYGGRLILNDADGRMNTKLGSQESYGYSGALLELYKQGNKRIEMNANSPILGGGGIIRLYNDDDEEAVVINSFENSILGATLRLGSGTRLSRTSGYINDERIATEKWVMDYVANPTPPTTE